MISRKIYAWAISVCVFALPIAVQAADMPGPPSYKVPIYTVEPFNWTGLYIGANLGYGWANSDWTGGSGNFQAAPKGWMAGGTLGYNFQTLGGWVLGVEGDIDYINLKGTATSVACATCTIKDTWLGTFRGRLGYGFDRWLPYITGGAAYGNMYIEAPGGSATGTKAGWTAGAGVEYSFSRNWSGKLEYLYIDLGSATCAQAACGFATETQVDFKANIVRAGLNYRF